MNKAYSLESNISKIILDFLHVFLISGGTLAIQVKAAVY